MVYMNLDSPTLISSFTGRASLQLCNRVMSLHLAMKRENGFGLYFFLDCQ